MQGMDRAPAERGVLLFLADGEASMSPLGDALRMTNRLPWADAAMAFLATEMKHEDHRLQLA